ncbi:MAG: membrane protein insertase YidC [Spirochaetes bacterium]|nr:membrane protein insertase YidC [Spirochaetota bacterium]
MNKNTLVALVLSLVVLMVWSYFIKKNQVPLKNDKVPPVFLGLEKITPDYKNGYLKLSWSKAKDDTEVTYRVFYNDKRIEKYDQPAYYSRETSILIHDLDISKNYYFAVKAYDQSENTDNNKKQVYFQSEFKSKGIQERSVSYKNKTSVFTFSTLGGRLKSISLKDYKTMDKKEQVQLVYYPEKSHSYYYPLDILVYNSTGNHDLLKFNDMVNYSSSVEKDSIIFKAILNNDLEIIKKYSFNPDGYSFYLTLTLKQISGKKGKYDRIALKWQPSLGPENTIDKYDKLVTSYYIGENIKNVSHKKKNYGNVLIQKGENIKWVAFHNRYFVAAMIPDESYNIKESLFYSDGKKDISGIISSLEPDKLTGYGIQLHYTIYAGPKLRDTFKSVAKLNTLNKTISSRKFIFGIGKLITKMGNLFLDVLIMIKKIVGNYGLAIILFTILIKLILYPLTHKQFESMVKMQKIQPIITQVREQYKKDPQQMNKELMQVYKKYKVNPLGGCLPLIMQMPIFFAMWDMLQYSLELRTASFLWIKSLALPDTIGYLGSIQINILPIIMGVTMLMQQTQTGTDPKQKKMMYFLPMIFLIFFWQMPSGLVLYWTVQNILSIGQQFLIKKYQRVEIGGNSNESDRKRS